ncbi:ArsR/SmtB family transcription factor [Natronobacterium gregoryi]|uniref:Transcriptional regulator TrmB n=1 Tax=Natronobacterium gregoryi (strain ATCC 43098 / DSM 3393 / CCM 3738 / CIP 104747 / IAM 13177 / JCM 8860 / NBRC 102187 / NCIMB 2189 / SP2) TaxID=797304 RepID=L9Y4K7_NATGS|nr:winged helix-turn-helix domain-containing protein [Natronobacterium gregoryi]ELY68994.1 transcriptional regulator TrmB [Natronobacterium gregoryi SP2]
MDDSTDNGTILGLLSDDYAREILQALSEDPATAEELTDRCSGSKVTVYRRLNDLEENSLVSATTDISRDGHHCKVYRNALSEVTVSITGDGPEVEVVRTGGRQ